MTDVSTKYRKFFSDIRQNYLNVVKYADANWYAPVVFISHKLNLDQFIYLDMGTSSTSIIPVKRGEPNVGEFESRLASGKLIPIGVLHTPVIYFVKEINIRGLTMKTFSYATAKTRDVLDIIQGDVNTHRLAKAKDRVAKLLACDVHLLSEDEICQIAKEIYKKLEESIENSIKRVVENNFQDYHKVYAVVAGNASQIMGRILKRLRIHYQCLRYGRSFTAIALIYLFSKVKGWIFNATALGQ